MIFSENRVTLFRLMLYDLTAVQFPEQLRDEVQVPEAVPEARVTPLNT